MSDAGLRNAAGWRVRLFGALVVEKPTGERVSLAGKKAGELLAYLALYPHQEHSRDRLVSLLWEDSDVGHVRTRLRQEIATLRALFPPVPGEAPLLLITQIDCRLQAGVFVDAVRFLDACSAAKQDRDGERKIRLLSEACALYGSDLLGEYDAHWIVAERVRFSQVYEQALLDLAEAYRLCQDAAGAEKALQCLLAHNPLVEEGHVALMRLYSEQGQPTRVQQQYQALERALRDITSAPPTEGTRQLADSLRAIAGRHASGASAAGTGARSDEPGLNGIVPVRSHAEPSGFPDGMAISSPAASATRHPAVAIAPSPQTHDAPRAATGAARSSRILATALLVLVLSAGVWYWKASHPPPSHVAPALVPLTRGRERWAFLYQPHAGEKPNAEGRAIAVDKTGIYVTGLIQTEKEDADILTIKLSLDGKLLWWDRYSSPEHDCDRAFSACIDAKGSVCVLGETYVPSTDSWHAVLLRYAPDGRRSWVKRAPAPMQKDDHDCRIESDRQGGCYVGGTALVAGKQAAIVTRFDATGLLLWQKPLPGESQSTFSGLVVNAEGTLFLCGTTRHQNVSGDANDDWIVAGLDPAGKVLWAHEEDGTAHRHDRASRIAIDRAGNILVGGVFTTGDPSQAGQGLNLGVTKYSPDGARLWQRIVKDSGPAVVLEGLSLNALGSLAVGGTEQRPDGNWAVVLAHYDSFGNLARTWRYVTPPGYLCATLHAPALLGDAQTEIVGQVGPGKADWMHDKSSLLFARFTPEGRLVEQALFDTGSYAPTIAYDINTQIGFLVTGRAGLPNGQGAFMVLHY